MPQVIRNRNGSWEQFALGRNSELMHRWSGASGDWSEWNSLGGNLHSFTVDSNKDGRLEVFGVRKSDNNVVHRYQNPSPGHGWSHTNEKWSSLGGNVQSIAVAANRDGRLEVFGVKKSDQSLVRRWQDPSHGWSDGWATTGSERVRDVVVVPDFNGLLEVYALNVSNRVRRVSQSDWSSWKDLGEQHFLQIDAGVNTDGRIEVFGVGRDHHSYHCWQDRPGQWREWREWDPFGGSQEIRYLSVIPQASAKLSAMATGMKGLPYRSMQQDNGKWTSWQYDPSYVSNDDFFGAFSVEDSTTEEERLTKRAGVELKACAKGVSNVAVGIGVSLISRSPSARRTGIDLALQGMAVAKTSCSAYLQTKEELAQVIGQREAQEAINRIADDKTIEQVESVDWDKGDNRVARSVGIPVDDDPVKGKF